MKATVRFTPFPVHTVPVHGSQRFTFFLVIVFDAFFSGAIVDTILTFILLSVALLRANESFSGPENVLTWYFM